MSALDAAWRELELDALASDGPIRDSDVKDAIRRNRPRIEAALANTPAASDGSLDVAWREAEEALPEGWAMLELKNTSYRGEGERWLAMANQSEPDDDYRTFKAGYGDTKEAALRALAARLSTGGSET